MLKYSNNCLIWLSQILTERFGPHFRLYQEDNKLKLHLDNDPNKSIIFPQLEAVFHQPTSDLPCSTWDAEIEGWNSILNSPLPAPGVDNIPSPLIIQNPNGFVINYDILGLTYWMLNRIEEIGRTDLDEHQRFPATSSHAYKYGYLERPIVDEWLHILGQVIQRLWPQLKIKAQEFSIKVSHDVDYPTQYGLGLKHFRGFLRKSAADVIKRRDIKSAMLAPYFYLSSNQKINTKDPFNTFEWIMDQSEKNNLTSAFYFICGRTDKRKDANYDPEHPAIRKLMKEIDNRGHEIGLHPSYNSFQSPSIIKSEANGLRKIMQEENIQQELLGGRMHYLRWEQPTTLQGWEDAELDYDSTLSYADMPGFRCGTCFEYQGFNPVRQKILKIRLRPLIAMESTIIDDRYLGLGYSDESLNKFSELKETCKKVNGSFTLLWHNSHFMNPKDKDFYKSLIV